MPAVTAKTTPNGLRDFDSLSRRRLPLRRTFTMELERETTHADPKGEGLCQGNGTQSCRQAKIALIASAKRSYSAISY